VSGANQVGKFPDGDIPALHFGFYKIAKRDIIHIKHINRFGIKCAYQSGKKA
jgi:hypothetical protein